MPIENETRVDPKTLEPEIYKSGAWITDWMSLNAAVQSFADADTPYVWSIPNAASVETVSFVLGDRRPTQDRKSALLSFTPEQLKETAAPWTHTVEGDQDVLSAIDVPIFYNWTIKSRVIAGDVLEITFNSVHRDNADLAAPDLGVDTFGGLFSLSVRYASTPGLSSVTTARFQPGHDYTAGDPILEPNPADNFAPYTWTADEDFTSGDDPDFDGTGFTAQDKAPVGIGIETDIINDTADPKTFSGRSIGKAIDIIKDQDLITREFRPALATQIYGLGNGKIRLAIDPSNGLPYAVRSGIAAVTSNAIPSQNTAEWQLLFAGVLPTIALADMQQIPFADLVTRTGQTYYLPLQQEVVVWDTNATPENVAPRRTYAAAAEPIPFVQGKWIVISPQPSNETVDATQFNEITNIGSVNTGFEMDTVNGYKGADAVVRAGVPTDSRIDVGDNDLRTRTVSWVVRKTVTPQTFLVEARDNPGSNSRWSVLDTMTGAVNIALEHDGAIAPALTNTVDDLAGYWRLNTTINYKAGNNGGGDWIFANVAGGGYIPGGPYIVSTEDVYIGEVVYEIEPFFPFTKIQTQNVANTDYAVYLTAAEMLEPFQPGDQVYVLMKRNDHTFTMDFIYVADGDGVVGSHQHTDGGNQWNMFINANNLNIKATSGGGAQEVLAIKVIR